MKKFGLVLALVLVIATTLSMAVSAGPHGITENYPIVIKEATPTIDGEITDGEGWEGPALMNANTLGYFWHQNPLTSDGNVFFAYSADGFYYSARITEGLSAVREADGRVYEEGYNTFVYSNSEDYIDLNAEGGNEYGYNGDIFGFMIDPLGTLLYDGGFVANEDHSAWYLVGLFEGDVAKMYRSKWNYGDITDQVQVAGKKTDTGWQFEAFLPWEVIISDTEAAGLGEITLTKEDILKDGALIRASAMYHDRFIDEELGDIATFGRYITVPKVLANGTEGQMGVGDNILSYGITLYVNEMPSDVDISGEDPGVAQNTSAKPPEGGEEGGQDTTTAAPDSQNTTKAPTGGANTTKAASKGSATGDASAQTFDIGIAVALGALATSGIGFVAAKKRK